VIAAVGIAFTVTVRDAVAVQLPVPVTVTVKVVVVAGEKVLLAPVPNPLLHEYDVPPLAVSVVTSPSHIVTDEGLMDAVGLAFTVTLNVAVAEHPLDPVAVTVYVVVDAGVKVADALEPPPLLQA
jgi:hypothetical protein